MCDDAQRDELQGELCCEDRREYGIESEERVVPGRVCGVPARRADRRLAEGEANAIRNDAGIADRRSNYLMRDHRDADPPWEGIAVQTYARDIRKMHGHVLVIIGTRGGWMQPQWSI